jgi:hypothetical protein
MGSSTILDIIGSVIVGGLLLITCLQLKLGANENQFVYNSSVNLQVNLVTLTTRMEDDFRKIAYCQNDEITPPSDAICYADTSKFRFMGDINNNGNIDSIEYSLGTNSYAPQNLRIKPVIRKYWEGASATAVVDTIKLGVTQMRFHYKTQNSDSSILTTPVNLAKTAVGVIDLAITLESPYRILDTSNTYIQDTSLYKVYWRQFRVVGKNLLYR